MTAIRITRRRTIATVGVATLTIGAPWGFSETPDRARRRYVDSVTGDDSRDGTTPETAFKTLAAALRSPPDSVWIWLARNSRFNGSLRVRPGMVVEAYGKGAMPVIDAASPLDGDGWAEQGRGVWVYAARIGHVDSLLLNGTRVSKRGALAAGDAPGSWAWIDGKVHLRSDKHPRDGFRLLQAIHRQCVSIIGADGATLRGIAAVNGVHGFVGQRSRDVTIEGCTAFDCAHNGFYLADDTAAWALSECVAERNGGAGFAFNYGAAASTVRRSRAARNGVDGCQFSEGCGSENALIECEFRENAIAGVNCKEKRQKILRCRMIDNGEAGAIAQINTELLEITDSVFGGNNRADNGTMNLALEDSARVVSTRNIFVGPYGRAKEAVNVRLIGRSALRSVTDCFIDTGRSGNVVASIRVATSGPSEVAITHGSFHNSASRIGRIIDCRGARNLSLSIANTAIAGTSICLAYEEGSRVATSHNCYHNATGGPIIEVAGAAPRRVSKENLQGFARSGGVEKGSIAADPQFSDPESFDLSLAAGSPARSAGTAEAGLVDALSVPFGNPTNIGAIAASGDLRKRMMP